MTTKRYCKPKGHTLILEFICSQITQLQSHLRLGTAQNYKKALHSFSTYLNGKDIPIQLINKTLINDYNSFLLQRGMVRNSTSFYMRILRAVYNKAVEQRLVAQSHPFSDVYTGIDQTHKRAIDESVIVKLYKMNLAEEPELALARDLFIFSYSTRGMAFIDISHLKKCNLNNGHIYYIRRKTGQKMNIKIEPCIEHIIKRYYSSDSEYIFPLLTSTDKAIAYRQYQKALNKYNRLLHKLSEYLPGNYCLTSYVARHSWATAARNHNIPISVISSGMGHTSERTTQIYLQLLENSVVDRANHKILRILR